MDTFRDYDEHDRWEIQQEEEEFWEARDERIAKLGLKEQAERYENAKYELDTKITALNGRAVDDAGARRDDTGGLVTRVSRCRSACRYRRSVRPPRGPAGAGGHRSAIPAFP